MERNRLKKGYKYVQYDTQDPPPPPKENKGNPNFTPEHEHSLHIWICAKLTL